MFSNLTPKEQPCHIYRDSMPLIQSNGDARVLEFSSDSICDLASYPGPFEKSEKGPGIHCSRMRLISA